jgi:hypothetical protein
MPGNFSSLGIGGGAIKSKQSGVNSNGTVTISSVNVNKALLSNLGGTAGSVVLTNSTTITIATAGSVAWQLVEYY